MNNSNQTHLINMHPPSTVLKPSLINRINMETSSPTPYLEKERMMLVEDSQWHEEPNRDNSNVTNPIDVDELLPWRNIQGEWTWLGRKHWSPRWGLYHAPVIPAGIWSFLWNLAESSGIIFGREPCQNCHSGYHLFQWNRAIPELGPEWSWNGPEQNPAECKKKKNLSR